MRKTIIIISTLFLLYVVHAVTDVLIAPPVTEAETERAHQYVADGGHTMPPGIFYHDGCTLFPDHFFWHDLYEACLNHDIAYWVGGSEELKLQADKKLSSDVAPTGPLGPYLGPVMYIAVHYLGNGFVSRQIGSNWGYGWNK